MRKALLSTALVALVAPVSAAAKTGIEFHRYPETAKVGEAIPFTMTVWREPRTPATRARPVAGIRPLVTFRSESGRVIRGRTGRTNRFGLAQGSVRFTDRGPWNVSYDLGRRDIDTADEISQPIHVGDPQRRQGPAVATGEASPASGGRAL